MCVLAIFLCVCVCVLVRGQHLSITDTVIIMALYNRNCNKARGSSGTDAFVVLIRVMILQIKD